MAVFLVYEDFFTEMPYPSALFMPDRMPRYFHKIAFKTMCCVYTVSELQSGIDESSSSCDR
jgi:hypothetical protein